MSRTRVPTLADVGRLAGVSRGTVSNVFNQPHIVRTDLRERVLNAARELGYDGPGIRGRILRDGRFNAIGIVPPGAYSIGEFVRSPYGRELILGAATACDAAGATLSLVNGTADSRATAIREAMVDGFILGQSLDLDIIASAQRRRLPFAIMDSDAGPDINSVRIDGRAGALMAIRHLAALGHRDYAILSVQRAQGPPVLHRPGSDRSGMTFARSQLDRERLDGFSRGLEDIGLTLDDVTIIETTPGDPTAGAAVFDHAPAATAIVTMSDWQAITVLDEAGRRGIDVPAHVSVVGFDGTQEAARTTPPLTTIAHDVVEKARIATVMVLEAGPPRQALLPVRLVVRGSTAAPRR